MSKSHKPIISVAILAFVLIAAAIFFLPRIKEKNKARKRAQPIIFMLRQGTTYETIGNAVNAITGTRFVTGTNMVTGVVSHEHMRQIPNFLPLSPRAAAMVQREMIEILPNVDGARELGAIFRSLFAFNSQGTLDLSESDWKVVEDAVDKYNRQQRPGSGGFAVVSAEDGTKQIALLGGVRQRGNSL